MPIARIHAGEPEIDESLVRRLLSAQFPEWAQLPLERVESGGTDHALYRMGADLCARLPRVDTALPQADKERRWLPQLAPKLPLEIPEPLALGTAAEGYPWHWSVYRWLDGDEVNAERIGDLQQAAQDLARFVAALQRIDASAGPKSGAHNFFRGVPLRERDDVTRSFIIRLKGKLDAPAATEVWEAVLQAPAWQADPLWIHGDIHPGNLLARDGRVTAVIDWGGLGVGDPACELIVAWNWLDARARVVFRDALDVDDATWLRGMGWALSVALVALPYYMDTNPVIVANSWHAIDAVLRGFG
jgi:aminoglycoside phosphotransferase (APT) family kinase protein